MDTPKLNFHVLNKENSSLWKAKLPKLYKIFQKRASISFICKHEENLKNEMWI